MSEKRERRLAFLRDLIERKASAPLAVLPDIFAESSISSSYWAGAGPGAKLAWELNHRVVYSSVTRTIRLVPLKEEEYNLAKIRFENEALRSKKRSIQLLDLIERERAALKALGEADG